MVKLESINWIKGSERESPILWRQFSYQGHTYKYFFEVLGLDFGFSVQRCIDHQTYLPAEDMKKLEEIFSAQIKHSSKYLDGFADRCQAECKRLLNSSRRIGKKNFETAPTQKLLKWFDTYSENTKRLVPFRNGTRALDKAITIEIHNLLLPVLGKRGETAMLQEYLSDLLIPCKQDNATKEMKSLLRIGAKLEKGENIEKLLEKKESAIIEYIRTKNPTVLSMINRHLKLFGWTNINRYFGRPMTTEDVIVRLRELLKGSCKDTLSVMNREAARRKNRFEQTIKKLRPSQKLLSLIRSVQEYLSLVAYRMEVNFIAARYIQPLFFEMACRMGIDYEAFIYLTTYEIHNCLENHAPVPLQGIRTRQKSFALTCDEAGRIEITVGRELCKIRSLEDSGNNNIKRIKGIVACQGEISVR